MSKIDLFAAIRRDVRDGLSSRAIEAKYRIGRRTVSAAVASALPPPRKTLRRQALSRWARRRADPAADALAYDEQHLLVRDLCAIATPAGDADQWWIDGDDRPQCRHCGTGHLIGYADRGQVPELEQRLAQLRARLAAGGR
jgi:hypothetical protein